MYSTCMFCNRDLGRNQVVESFPVGRRLAYDPEKGRLWVVCRKCERWNLTPLEERWEAIEDAERMYRGTRLRASTENMGLARLPEGLELVRVGRPARPEFAAWRYGDQFGRRRKRQIIYTAAGAVVFGTVLVGGVTTGVISGALMGQSGNFVNMWVNGRTRVKVRTADGCVLKLKLPELRKTRIVPSDQGLGWAIELTKKKTPERFEGNEAERVAGLVLPAINSGGAKRDQVQDAVSLIEEVGHPEAFLEGVKGMKPLPGRGGRLSRKKKRDESGQIMSLSKPTRLAIEMALHEEKERRALHGELKALEIAWRQAEEIAAIADNLLLPDDADARLEELRLRADAEDDPEEG